ncbi:tetraacyldisaccharide 4'-kinase [candidate division KSB1 bacterium]|nr:tetraacyldisaccharide 4'-kinase [candidate division KSB1 bacterium]MBL7095197.1 tetraacyldisaccharide 4'-kinase [candidate division KSB1 bacterium]
MNIFENRIIQITLMPVSLVYGLIIRCRNFFYDYGLFSTKKISGCKIICVGNISVGGTGKTPVVKFLAGYLNQRGFNVAILSRGYGRKSKGTVVVSDGKNTLANLEDSGDEPLLLANQLKTIPVIVEADRVKGAQFILKQFVSDVILLDDAYQHRRIFRDINIVLIDASRGFGRNYLLPSGFLREPVSSLKRADLVLFTRVDSTENIEQLQKITRQNTSCPQVTSSHVPAMLIRMTNNQKFDLAFLKDKKVLLFSGIANQTSFQQVVKKLGATVVFHEEFPDHFFYTPKDIKNIITRFRSTNCDLILTTEKDYYRLVSLVSDYDFFYYLTIEISIINGFDNLAEKLASIF